MVAQDEWSPKPGIAQDRFYCTMIMQLDLSLPPSLLRSFSLLTWWYVPKHFLYLLRANYNWGFTVTFSHFIYQERKGLFSANITFILTLKNIVSVKHSFTFFWKEKFVFFFSSSLLHNVGLCSVLFIVRSWLLRDDPIIFRTTHPVVSFPLPDGCISIFHVYKSLHRCQHYRFQA